MGLATKNNNPGNLRDPSTGDFRKFSSPDEGYAALMNDLHAKVTGATSTGLKPDSTLYDFAKTYAPRSDNNNPEQYTANLANTLGVRPDTKLSDLQNRIPEFAHAVASNEDQDFVKQHPLQLNNTQQNKQSEGYVTAPQLSQQQIQESQNQTNNQPQDNSLGSKLGEDIKEGGEGLSQAAGSFMNMLGGKDNVPIGLVKTGAGLLHVAGSAGKAVGDVGMSLIEQIPGTKSLENFIGEKVGNYAQTPGGQAIVKSLQEFQQKNPELSQAIGDVFNITTAIPVFRGLGALKDVALDMGSQVLKKQAEKVITEDLTSAASKTVGGRKALQANPDVIKTLIDERAVPDIVDNKYVTKEAADKLEENISQADDYLDTILKSKVNSATPVLSIEQMRNDALKSAKKELEGQTGYKSVASKINELFDTANESDKTITINGNNYLKLDDANFFKRQARQGLKWDDTIGQDAGYHVGQSYMKGIENIAEKEGLGPVKSVNSLMGRLLEAKKVLSHIEAKKPELGTFANLTQLGATAAGSAAASSLGFSPEVGGYISNKVSGLINKKLKNLAPNILERTQKGALKKGLITSAKKIDKATTYGLLQSQFNKGKQNISQ